jgi:phosphatidylglycerophosphatase C
MHDAPAPAAAPLAAFDLDGTITWADAFTTFLRARLSRMAFWARITPLAPLFPAYLAGRIDRKRLKELFAERFLGGLDAETIAAEADAFWDGAGARLLRADALAEIARRREAGENLVIVTACPELVAAPLARRLGLAILGTRLETQEGRLTGRIAGENCRGAEKIARLEAAYGPELVLAAAFGDSAGDHEMLARAETGLMKPFRDGPPLALAATLALWF